MGYHNSAYRFYDAIINIAYDSVTAFTRELMIKSSRLFADLLVDTFPLVAIANEAPGHTKEALIVAPRDQFEGGHITRLDPNNDRFVQQCSVAILSTSDDLRVIVLQHAS